MAFDVRQKTFEIATAAHTDAVDVELVSHDRCNQIAGYLEALQESDDCDVGIVGRCVEQLDQVVSADNIDDTVHASATGQAANDLCEIGRRPVVDDGARA